MARTPSTEDVYEGDGTTAVFQFHFPFLDASDVFVSVDDVNVSFTILPGSIAQVQLTVPPAAGTIVKVYRSTLAIVPKHLFASGVPFLPRYVDENNRQLLYASQEAINDTAVIAAEALVVAEEAKQIAQDAEDKIDGAIIDSSFQLRLDLADPTKGTDLLAYNSDIAGVITGTLSERLDSGDLRAFQFLTPAERAQVVAGTGGDMRAQLQLAIDTAVSLRRRLIIDSGLWRITPLANSAPTNGLCLDVPSNAFIVHEPQAKLELTAHNHTIYQMYRVWDRTNVTIWYAQLDGRRDLNVSITGEFGMGIDVRGGSGIAIVKAQTDNMWGDGLYVGLGAANATVTDLYAPDHKANNCRRQGMSMISGRRVVFDRPRWTNINGAAPQAGCDFEPNSNLSVFEGVRINNPYTENCLGGGIVGYFQNLAGAGNRDVDIVVTDHLDVGSVCGMQIGGLNMTGAAGFVRGTFTTIRPNWRNNSNAALNVFEHDSRGFAIRVVDPVVRDWNRSGQSSPRYGSAFVVLRDSTSVLTYPIGNVDIIGADVVISTGTAPKLFHFHDTVDRTRLNAVNFIDPKRISGPADYTGWHGGTGFISDRYNQMRFKVAGSTSITFSNYGSLEFPDTGSNITLGAGSFVANGPPLYIYKPNNANTHNVVGPAAGAFLGELGTVTQMRSVVPGSYLKLIPMGADKFLIAERVGAWTAV